MKVMKTGRESDIIRAKVSDATLRNWNRLGADAAGRLQNRANKRLSRKMVVAEEYACAEAWRPFLDSLLPYAGRVADVMYTLCTWRLNAAGILHKSHVREALRPFSRFTLIGKLSVPEDVLGAEEDVLGFIYQSLCLEGERNEKGQYYTGGRIVDDMLGGLTVGRGRFFLDPCCGSGAFLMRVKCESPDSLYGVDSDPVAVMVARTNLLIKYSEVEFAPKVYCLDFLSSVSLPDNAEGRDVMNMKFDYIYTNPPWGVEKGVKRGGCCIRTGEKSSMFLVKAHGMLASGGFLGFLMPTSILKTGAHRDVRNYIVRHSAIKEIAFYDGRFDGVFTDFFSLKLSASPAEEVQRYVVRKQGEEYEVTFEPDAEDADCLIPTDKLCGLDRSVTAKVEKMGNDRLTHSLWALGIVTGNNKEKLSGSRLDGYEPIFTGKEVSPFALGEERFYVRFEPDNFQQCAKEHIYRAKEKLIYKFISSVPVFAYDTCGSLCLNSANVLVPDIETLSIKSVAALLNSELYRYLYMSRFKDIKVLKGNLQRLPFPRFTERQDAELVALVDRILAGENVEELISGVNDFVYSFFGVTEEERCHIKDVVSKKIA